jgi:hypothetical protein
MEQILELKEDILYVDEQMIARNVAAINNAKPLAEAVFESYNAIPGLPKLDPLSWHEIYFDTDKFIQERIDEYYDTTFGDVHGALGIDPEDGKKLTAKKLPDFSDFKAKVSDHQRAFSINCCAYDAFTIEGDELIIDPVFVSRSTDACKLILKTELEHTCKAAIVQLIEALKNLDKAIPRNAFQLHPGGLSKISAGVDGFDLNQLFELIKISTNPYDATVPPMTPVFTINNDFFGRLKRLINERQIA